jgi:polysaccharide export outer membrane protein
MQALNDSLREFFIVSKQALMPKHQTAMYRQSYSKKSQFKLFSFLQESYFVLAACLLFSPPVFAQQKPIGPNPPLTPNPPSKDVTQQQQPTNGQVAAPVSFTAGVSRSGYLLGPGDQFKLTVFDYEEFTGPQVVLPDGNISLPIVGSIQAADRTTDELSQEITQRLRPYLKNPIVTVALSTLRPLRINISGEVQRPGPIQLASATSTTNNTPAKAATVSSALIEAGGVTREADIRKVILKRYNPNKQDQKAEESNINLWDTIWSDKVNRDITLQDGDSLYIPKLTAGDTLDRRLIARSSLSPKTVKVRVVGEVKKPGEVEIPPTGSISGAVAIAGGPTDKADLGQVAFTRLNTDGRIESKSVDLNKLADIDQVQEGDVVIVPKSSSSSFLDTFSQVISPFYGLFNLFR